MEAGHRAFAGKDVPVDTGAQPDRRRNTRWREQSRPPDWDQDLRGISAANADALDGQIYGIEAGYDGTSDPGR